MTASPRTLILCADDYALHPVVDEAVEQLALAGRLSATSCMTTSPRWREAAARLQGLRPRLSVGLHFNLTEGHGGAARAKTLGAVIRAAYCRQLPQAELRTQWCEQLDSFEQAMGCVPDFIDGHQHVHQLPGVRAAMLAELQSRYTAQQLPWVRSTAPAGGLWRSPKAAIIALLGGWNSTRSLRLAGVAQNQGFGGVYGFDAHDAAAYGAHMAHWLPQLGEASLVMCHPATQQLPGDAIGAQRPVEFAYLMSEEFGLLLAQQNMQVAQGSLRHLLR